MSPCAREGDATEEADRAASNLATIPPDSGAVVMAAFFWRFLDVRIVYPPQILALDRNDSGFPDNRWKARRNRQPRYNHNRRRHCLGGCDLSGDCRSSRNRILLPTPPHSWRRSSYDNHSARRFQEQGPARASEKLNLTPPRSEMSSVTRQQWLRFLQPGLGRPTLRPRPAWT